MIVCDHCREPEGNDTIVKLRVIEWHPGNAGEDPYGWEITPLDLHLKCIHEYMMTYLHHALFRGSDG